MFNVKPLPKSNLFCMFLSHYTTMDAYRMYIYTVHIDSNKKGDQTSCMLQGISYVYHVLCNNEYVVNGFFYVYIYPPVIFHMLLQHPLLFQHLLSKHLLFKHLLFKHLWFKHLMFKHLLPILLLLTMHHLMGTKQLQPLMKLPLLHLQQLQHLLILNSMARYSRFFFNFQKTAFLLL